jgi:hypothetical protein
MKLNVEPLYTYFITTRESCFEFMYCTDRPLVECKYTSFRILCKLCSDPYSEQISMSNANTQISSLWVSHVSRHYSSQIGCMSSVKTLLHSVGVSHVCSPYSAQSSCKSYVIIWISSLFESNVSRLTSIQFCFRLNAIKRNSSLVAPKFWTPYSAHTRYRSKE